jgi:hypothetical protein
VGLFDRLRGKGKPSAESALVYALSTTTGSGPSDGLNGRDGKPYWVSTLRYPAGHWQTVVFDHSAQDSLDHPLFLINTTSHPGDALQNHLAALILVAESPRPEWPTGLISTAFASYYDWPEPEDGPGAAVSNRLRRGKGGIGTLDWQYRSRIA